MTDINVLQHKLDTLSLEVDRLKSVNDITNLMSSYEYLHFPHLFHRKPELFALSMPDVSMDLSNGGIFVGKDAIEFLWNGLLGRAGNEPGAFFLHTLTTPNIQVSGDGETAKAIWLSPGLETYYHDHAHTVPEGHVEGKAPMRAYWCWGKYACDFIREKGEWKIWHMKWIRSFRCDFYESWVDDKVSTAPAAAYPKFPRDDIKPPRFHEPYNPKIPQKAIPAIPQPYETFDDPDWIYSGYEDVIPPKA
ncbi:nuclear transport factor 2 family protein [Novosphingobium flavum]|uniref:Nuclear transport factor 2 family protein n=1 Tax=Novosphingobium flavum TaxID=1778672 RepID=A0A7X1FRM8_9SPHN|nr:nuclear transport factor 2 family protein [Novosphingobium flavum]